MKNQISTGAEYRRGRWHFDVSYAIDPTTQQAVRRTALLSGEYANSKVRIGTQAVGLGTAFRF